MIFVIVGDNFKEREKSLSDLRTKFPFEKRSFDVDNFDLNEISGMVSTNGLFGDSCFVFCNNVFVEDSIFSYCVGNIEAMRNSDSVFCFAEDKVLAPEKKKLGLKKSELLELPKKIKTNKSFNLFLLTDALVSGSKKDLWVLFRKALQSGEKIDDIMRLLLWQYKTLVLAKKSSSASEAGLKPFIFNKSSSCPIDLKDIQSKYKELLSLYHDSRRGKNSIDSLEKFILT